MILELKFKEVETLNDNTLRITTNCEDFRAMLDNHSPNLLIDYLNMRYGTKFPIINNPHKKGGCHGNV